MRKKLLHRRFVIRYKLGVWQRTFFLIFFALLPKFKMVCGLSSLCLHRVIILLKVMLWVYVGIIVYTIYHYKPKHPIYIYTPYKLYIWYSNSLQGIALGPSSRLHNDPPPPLLQQVWTIAITFPGILLFSTKIHLKIPSSIHSVRVCIMVRYLWNDSL